MHCDTPDNIKRCFGQGFKIQMISDDQKHQKLFKQKSIDMK
jgi:hypothetical protein